MIKDLDFSMPTKLLFGQGRLKEVGEETRKYGQKALLVTGKRSAKKLGFTDGVIEYLKSEKVRTVLYDKVEPNPDKQTVDTGATLAKEEGCDIVVALGGGSALDVGKGITVVVSHGGEVWKYMGEGNVPGPTLPLIAIPTTAGTGSETTPFAMLSFREEKIKTFMGSPFIFPKVAIVDPTLMVAKSSYLSACTGMDALSHALEAYTSKLSQPISDRIALQAIELCSKSLPKVVMNGNNLEARTDMALASSLAGMAIAQAGCGNAHTIGNTVGGFFETDHGALMGLLLPHVMEYNIFTNLGKFIEIARIMGEKVDTLSPRCAAMKAVEAIKNLLIDIGLPQRLKDLGVTEDAIPAMVKVVMKTDPNEESARIVGPEDIEYLFGKAF